MKTLFLCPCVCVAVSLFSPGPLQAQFVLTKVADTSTAIPNGSGNFTGFTPGYGPATSQGSVAFYAAGVGNQSGYYVQTNGVLFAAVDTNTPAPGGGTFGSFSFLASGFEANSLYFVGSSALQGGMFIQSNGVITQLIDANTIVPGTTNKFSSFILLCPFDGRVAFLGQGDGNSQRGIYRLDSGIVSKLADTNDNYIGGVGKLSFVFSSAEIAHDANGAVAFFAADSSPPNRQGLFAVVSNTLIRIASTDTAVPARTNLFGGPNPVFSRKPDISDRKIVFVGRFIGGSGVYQANLDGSGAVKIADTDTLIPGSTNKFASFQDAAIELGTVVFTAQGPGIYGAYRHQDGVLNKIIAKPDTLDGKTVETVTLSNQGLSGGRVALQIQFSNGSIGIYSAIVGYANQGPAGGTLVAGSLLYSAATGFSFQFTGEAGRAYRIQYNTNLASTNWTTLTNFTYTAPLTITDSGAVSSARRVYRAISP